MFVVPKLFLCASRRIYPYSVVHYVTKAFSTASIQESMNNLIPFLASIYKVGKQGSSGTITDSATSSLSSLQDQLVGNNLITKEEVDHVGIVGWIVMEMTQVVNELQKVLVSESNIESILQQIKENELLSSFCNASKRTIEIGDYYAYYLLYPLVVSSLVMFHLVIYETIEFPWSIGWILHAYAE